MNKKEWLYIKKKPENSGKTWIIKKILENGNSRKFWKNPRVSRASKNVQKNTEILEKNILQMKKLMLLYLIMGMASLFHQKMQVMHYPMVGLLMRNLLIKINFMEFMILMENTFSFLQSIIQFSGKMQMQHQN